MRGVQMIYVHIYPPTSSFARELLFDLSFAMFLRKRSRIVGGAVIAYYRSILCLEDDIKYYV